MTTKSTLNKHLPSVISDIVMDYNRGDKINDARAALLECIEDILLYDSDDEDVLSIKMKVASIEYASSQHKEYISWKISCGLRSYFDKKMGVVYRRSEDILCDCCDYNCGCDEKYGDT